MKPKVVIFDVNETLTDMEPLRGKFEEVGLPGALMATWFAGVLRDGFALTAAGGFAEFGRIAADVLEEMGAGEEAVSHVLKGFTELSVHPDVPEGMRLLRASGIRLFTMTNGAAAMTQGILRREGLLDLVEATLDVSGPRAWKPARAAYEYAVGRAGVRPDQAALVAVHPWDIDGAQRAGLAGAWLERRGMPYPSVMSAPRLTAPDLVSLARQWA
ncbi:haloacid dehalogenase type II [Nonomuraea phyllanthi]|uniref:Haloacid dehalogenase type II n=1 Tax=Nonomuraea phyllanthi TaxID=2219224 RepID=A0A5C4VJT0_9ACTN|nr:haloacid dehalogenase type II [Nonomuraea phyllanthi]KAB8191089.1 haloacid dehalogenase type II [Nonomuraea phyllanthi]QFY12851.1 haloacid dehalogenase type II [Nonomuraea phyllanthi]